MTPTVSIPMSDLTRYLSALDPRSCTECGASTGSGALEKCADCDELLGEERASECPPRTLLDLLAADGQPEARRDVEAFKALADRRDAGKIDNEQYDDRLEPIMRRAEEGGYIPALVAAVLDVTEMRRRGA